MRLLLLLAVCATSATAPLLALDGVTVGRWNGMLLVTAPGGSGVEGLGGRLAQRITLDARDQPLTETADFLRSATGLNIVLAPALIAKPPQLTLQVKDMSLGNLVHWIERTTNVHAGFVNNALYFAEQPITGASSTRLYDVSDLAMTVRDFPGPTMEMPTPGGNGSKLQTPIAADDESKPRYDLDQLQSLVEQFISGQK